MKKKVFVQEYLCLMCGKEFEGSRIQHKTFDRLDRMPECVYCGLSTPVIVKKG